mmetsp:Transcript_13458/g.29181  ORF Transcript_13458/g.29181 Transcript_13458/m.29181 type:complete len:346 (-) Transcript_13458:339-1376(-)
MSSRLAHHASGNEVSVSPKRVLDRRSKYAATADGGDSLAPTNEHARYDSLTSDDGYGGGDLVGMFPGESAQGRSTAPREKSRETTLDGPPHLAFAPAGCGWSKDLLCMMHNGLRRELRDLCYIAGSMRKRKLSLGSEDFTLFLDWFAYLPDFYSMLEKIKDDVIYSKLSACGIAMELPRALVSRPQSVASVQSRLVSVLKNYSAGGKDSLLPPAQRIDELVGTVMQISESMMELVHAEEVALPKYIDQCVRSEEERKAVVEHVVHSVRGGKHAHRHFILLVRWIADAKSALLKEWRAIYIDNGGLRASRSFTKEYNEARVEFRKNHARIVHHFYEAWNDFEKVGK